MGEQHFGGAASGSSQSQGRGHTKRSQHQSLAMPWGAALRTPPQSTRTQGHRQPRGRLRSESRFIPLDLTPVSPFFLLILLLMACSWHERSLEAISRCGRKPRAAVIHPAAGGGRRGEQAAAAMVSGQIGEAQGGPPKPPAGTAPCARPGAAARGHPQPWKRPCTHKTPVANFSSSQGGSRSSDCRLGPKRKRVGRAERGESISRPQESGLGGPCPRLPAPQTPPCFRGRSPCLIPQPQMIPLSPPEHHAAQPCPAAARWIPQLLAFLPRSHPRHLQSIARSLKIK